MGVKGVGKSKHVYRSLGVSRAYRIDLMQTNAVQQIKVLGSNSSWPDKSPRRGVIYARDEFEVKEAATHGGFVPIDEKTDGREFMILRWRSGKRSDVKNTGNEFNEIDLIYDHANEDYMVFSEDEGCGSAWPTLTAALEEFESKMLLDEPINLKSLYGIVGFERYEVGTRDLPSESDALSVQSRAELYRETESFGRWS